MASTPVGTLVPVSSALSQRDVLPLMSNSRTRRNHGVFVVAIERGHLLDSLPVGQALRRKRGEA